MDTLVFLQILRQICFFWDPVHMVDSKPRLPNRSPGSSQSEYIYSNHWAWEWLQVAADYE